MMMIVEALSSNFLFGISDSRIELSISDRSNAEYLF